MISSKNLFILHTQYNIILSVAVISNEFQSCRNDLILYAEFQLNDELYNSLTKVFDNILIIRDRFEKSEKNPIKRECKLFKDYIKYKLSDFGKVKYDRVFLSQERPFDVLVVGDQKLKHEIHVCDIEEDCYYSINSHAKEQSPKTLNSKTDIFRKILYGNKYVYEPIYFYGQSSQYHSHYVTFPRNVRSELTYINLIDISKKNIETAISLLYPFSCYIPHSEKYIIIFFDLINRYNNPLKIFEVFTDLINMGVNNGYMILCKYHPRESQKIEIQEKAVFELPNVIPAEKVLSDLVGKDVLVIGNATTSILMARKLNFRTMSVAVIDGNQNVKMIDKFQEIGIEMPSSLSDVFKK